MRILHNLTGAINLRKTRLVQLRKCHTASKRDDGNSIEAKWFLEKEDEILNLVNKSNIKELTKYIQQPLAETIISNRTADGPYKSLDELLSKNEIDSDSLNKFYTLIIDHKMQRRKWKKFTITPDVKTIMMPKTILGIHVGPTAITWTLMNSNCQVLDWDCIVWRDKFSKMNTYDLINLTSSIACALPESNSYVIEEFQIGKKSMQHILFNQQLVTIGISSCLKLIQKQRTSNSLGNLESNIYVLHPLASARFFNLMIGQEVIASEYVTKVILNDVETDKKEAQDVRINNELKKKYMDKEPDHREQMGWSLLKALTFVRLVMIFNTNVLYKSSV